MIRGESIVNILRAKDPGVVRKPTGRVGPAIGVDQLPGGRDTDFILVKSVTLGILDEMEEVRVRAIELLRAIDAERVVPDHPAATSQLEVVLGEQLDLRGLFIADSDPESDGRF